MCLKDLGDMPEEVLKQTPQHPGIAKKQKGEMMG